MKWIPTHQPYNWKDRKVNVPSTSPPQILPLLLFNNLKDWAHLFMSSYVLNSNVFHVNKVACSDEFLGIHSKVKSKEEGKLKKWRFKDTRYSCRWQPQFCGFDLQYESPSLKKWRFKDTSKRCRWEPQFCWFDFLGLVI